MSFIEYQKCQWNSRINVAGLKTETENVQLSLKALYFSFFPLLCSVLELCHFGLAPQIQIKGSNL